LPQPSPAQTSATHWPSWQILDWPPTGLQVWPAQLSGSQNPSMPHRSPILQATKVHAWTQSPWRQNVPLGQATPRHGSARQAPSRHSSPSGQPLK
jgi:hypothetical protein